LTLTAWRITKRKHAKLAFNGEGARRFGGRWNSPGTAIVYTAESQSLAALEMLVHLGSPELLDGYVLFAIGIDESLVVQLVGELPRNWRSNPVPNRLREQGDEWVRAGTSAVLQVPSVLIPAESNFLLNPRHPDFPKLEVSKPLPFQFDSRLTGE